MLAVCRRTAKLGVPACLHWKSVSICGAVWFKLQPSEATKLTPTFPEMFLLSSAVEEIHNEEFPADTISLNLASPSFELQIFHHPLCQEKFLHLSSNSPCDLRFTLPHFSVSGSVWWRRHTNREAADHQHKTSDAVTMLSYHTRRQQNKNPLHS